MSATARVYGLLDRVGDALAEERERLELKSIEILKGPKRLVQPEPVNHAWWDDGFRRIQHWLIGPVSGRP